MRLLSLDEIDPIIDDPSSINEACSTNPAETKAQQIERVLREACDGFFEAFDVLRKAQEDAVAPRK